MKEHRTQKVLIDIGVLLEYPDIITRIRTKRHLPVLLAETMVALINYRAQPTQHGQHADRILSQIEGSQARKVDRFPTGDKLAEGDHLSEFRFDQSPAYLLKRLQFRAITPSTRMIEVAAQYRMTIVSCDDQIMRLAKSSGVTCHRWQPDQDSEAPSATKSTVNSARLLSSDPFKVQAVPLASSDVKLSVKALPGTNEAVIGASGRQLRLGKKVSEGGEGVIYETDDPTLVCKVYHLEKLTSGKRQKIELMTTRKVAQPGICWPTETVSNQLGEFVGYVMPRAQGRTMQTSMFVKPLLQKTFPAWGRIDLVNLCLAFLAHVQFLHKMNVLIGDINPQNLLVTQDSQKIWLVDTDSFQVEGFPCPVGTVNFTAPEIQGLGYESFMRTNQHELFAVATMLFMILFPGKPPYSQQGGGSPADNIKTQKFPYRNFDDKENFSGENAPRGSWGIIWNHLSKHLREAFHQTFSCNKRLTIEQWTALLKRYRYAIENKYLGNEIFPTSYFFIRDPITVICGKCQSKTTASKKYADSQAMKGLKVWCQECHRQHSLKRMATESEKEGLQAEKRHQSRPPASTQPIRPKPLPRTAPTVPQPKQQPQRAAQAQTASSQQRPVARPQTVLSPRAQPTVSQRPPPRSTQQTPARPNSWVARLLKKLWLAVFFK